MKGIATGQAPSLVASPASGPLGTPSSSQFLAAPVPFRNKNELLRRCRIKCADFQPSSAVACNFQRNSFWQLRSASTSFTLSDRGSLSLKAPLLPHIRKSTILARAYKDPFSFRVLSGTEKPEWWWRTLSCIPYLLALQVSDTGIYLQRFINKFGFFENAVFYIPGAVNRLPTWFPMLYCYLAYNGIVNNKEWPLFFRFHVIMGILMEISLQLIWQSSNFMPFVHYNGALGMYYWAAVGVAYILMISECIRCALSGRYVRIPFLGKRAMLHAVLGLGAYQLPF